MGGRDTESDEKLEQLIRPPSSLTFELKSPEVDLTDDHYRKLAFFTDGRKLQKSKDESYQEIAAHWDGMQLVTDEKTPQGSKMSRTFELSPDGRQFTETVHVDRGKSKGLVTIRYVFDAAGANTEVDHAADPNVPVLKRHADTSTGDSPSPQTGQAGQIGQGQASDPDQPVLKRHDDGGNSPQ
jgi:hypothetical protein